MKALAIASASCAARFGSVSLTLTSMSLVPWRTAALTLDRNLAQRLTPVGPIVRLLASPLLRYRDRLGLWSSWLAFPTILPPGWIVVGSAWPGRFCSQPRGRCVIHTISGLVANK